MPIRLALLIAAVLLCSPAFAGLIDEHFKGKTEAEVATEFEAGLGEFLAARLKEELKPRIRHSTGRDLAWLEVVEVNEGEGSWQVLARDGRWMPAQRRYVYVPFGRTYKFKHAEIPPYEVLGWFESKYRLPGEMIALACWLAGKKALVEANHALADLASDKPELRPAIEAWLCEKNGWSAPEDGLLLIDTYDLERDRGGKLLMTKDAAEEHYKALDKEGRRAMKELERMHGGDVKSKPGFRRTQPALRLETLQDYVTNFGTRYANTAFFEKRSNKKTYDDILEAVKADLAWVETEIYAAGRLGIEDDWAGAAKAYDRLLRADPHNVDLLQKTAEAHSKRAVITDGGRKADDKDAAKTAAQLYERMCEEYPVVLAFHNYAGLNWLAAGDAKKAKQFHQEVVRRTDNREDLSEGEKSNREFAERQLKLIG